MAGTVFADADPPSSARGIIGNLIDTKARQAWSRQYGTAVVIAESDDTVVVDGDHYFPEASLNRQYVTSAPPQRLPTWERPGALLQPAGHAR